MLAGPTASGKSALALSIAEAQGRHVVNADALQVFGCWRCLTARPDPADLARAPHALYGHVDYAASYSVGDWLRDVTPLLALRPAPVIVGGTGLYLTSLTKGLSEIPATRPEIRALSNTALAMRGPLALAGDLDGATRARIDLDNPRRIQRAWEVQAQTGRGLAAWHGQAMAPALPPSEAHLLVLDAGRAWLDPRIAARFAAMLADGALREVAEIAPRWDPALPASRAIGAAQLMDVLHGRITESQAHKSATQATRRYAKRQRTWFRAKMRHWTCLEAPNFGEAISAGMATSR